ncbi:hypothetical protein, partial [Ruegeria sp. Ofav3-42]|uniref:hypothetical protein n=1 Tax=Ruegeria sp. Ofav3-42 TaxID=2917759 RepID=UPI001EF5E253
NRVSERFKFSTPIMAPGTRFHRNGARWQFRNERQKIVASELFTKHHLARGAAPMKLKHILRQIYADKVQIRHFANLLTASISKTYQMRDQEMSIPSKPLPVPMTRQSDKAKLTMLLGSNGEAISGTATI